jgi:tetratricopeptide (TPR) repeat protein
MKRILFILFSLHLSIFTALAQTPSWTKKAAQAVFTLKTFNADGQLIGSVNGFFISDQGDAVSCYTPFKGASRAVVIDAQGKEWPVECIKGANDMYDVARFQVNTKKATTLTIAPTTAAVGTAVWLLPYTANKSVTCTQGTVNHAEKFQTTYDYYTLDMQADEQAIGSPVCNDAGQVIGMLQPAAGGQSATSYAVSARFAADQCMKGLSINETAMRATSIAKALPDTYEEALIALYMGASVMDETQYDAYINRFIQQFPQAADGYIYRARNYAARDNFSAADDDMKQALRVADNKDDVHYQYAQLIWQKELLQPDKPFAAWTMERALEESQEAYKSNPQAIYRQQQAQILYALKRYDEAYTIYDELTHSNLRSADIFYAAAQCKLQLDDKKAALALLDSAVNTFTRPYIKTAAPYLRARAELSMDCKRYQLAINDMQDVVALEPNNAELWAQKASYEIRVKLVDQALESAKECLRLDPTGSDGYLMSGIALCMKGEKQEGLQNLQKAKELGDSQAQTFIDKYGN